MVDKDSGICKSTRERKKDRKGGGKEREFKNLTAADKVRRVRRRGRRMKREKRREKVVKSAPSLARGSLKNFLLSRRYPRRLNYENNVGHSCPKFLESFSERERDYRIV